MIEQTPNYVGMIHGIAPYIIAALILLLIVVTADNWPKKPKLRTLRF